MAENVTRPTAENAVTSKLVEPTPPGVYSVAVSQSTMLPRTHTECCVLSNPAGKGNARGEKYFVAVYDMCWAGLLSPTLRLRPLLAGFC